MMAVAYSVLTLVLCLLNGGGNDLIDYLPTESFWKVKHVDVTVEKMLAELVEKPSPPVDSFIAQLGSPDAATRDEAAAAIRDAGGSGAEKLLREAAESQDAEVRRRARTLLRDIVSDEIVRSIRQLMAIRTLGELGKTEAVPRLKELLQSKELFIAEYAQVAIDRIEGRTSEGREVSPRVAEDVWLLPHDCKTVGQLVPRRGGPIGFAEFMATLKNANQPDREENTETVTRVILSLAEQIGNVRIDSATFGLTGNVVPQFGGDPGYVAVILRGRYNAEWARTLAQSEHVPARNEDGVEIFEPDNEQAWIMPSNEMFVFLASPVAERLPIKEMAITVMQGKSSQPPDDAAKKLIESFDSRQILWAVSALTPNQRKLPVASAFQTVAITGTRDAKILKLKIVAQGDDTAKISEAVDAVNNHAKKSADFLDGIKEVPVIDMAVQLLRSVHVNADGESVTLTASLQTTPAAILSLPMLYDEEDPPPADTHERLRRRD